jgi:flagellar FliL protein
MSAATAGADAGAAPAKGKKKLILIVAAVAVLALLGVGALLMMKKSAHAEDEEAAEAPVKEAAAKARDPKAAPVFAPLDPFTVNLADKEAERYAQVGITLELDDPTTAESLKVYMPAVRNHILMLLAHKTSAELLERDGKDRLAREVAREASRGLGVEIEEEAADEDEDASASKKKRKKKAPQALPVTAVYFSTFIIQ